MHIAEMIAMGIEVSENRSMLPILPRVAVLALDSLQELPGNSNLKLYCSALWRSGRLRFTDAHTSVEL
jgi:hypothetical protein